ncbi:AMP-binding protein [Streptomyces sp. M19]
MVSSPPRWPGRRRRRGAEALRGVWSLLGRPLILTDLDAGAMASALSGRWGEDVPVAGLADVLSGRRDADWFPARPDSPALNLLTSGSTGVPKCVRHDHRSLAARTWGTRWRTASPRRRSPSTGSRWTM